MRWASARSDSRHLIGLTASPAAARELVRTRQWLADQQKKKRGSGKREIFHQVRKFAQAHVGVGLVPKSVQEERCGKYDAKKQGRPDPSVAVEQHENPATNHHDGRQERRGAR